MASDEIEKAIEDALTTFAGPPAHVRSPEEQEAVLNEQRETLRAAASAIPVKMTVYDDEHGALISLEFCAVVTAVTIRGDNYGETKLTTFSNGCVLKERKVLL